MRKSSFLLGCAIAVLVLCSGGMSWGSNCSFGTNDPNACMCGVRPTDSSKACQDNSYYCSPTAYSCMFRIPENQACPVAFETKHYGDFSAPPCQQGLVCCPGGNSSPDMGGVCRRSCSTATACSPPAFTGSLSLPDATKGQPYQQQIQANGAPAPVTYAVASGALPSGLQLGSAGGISGTPTASGTFTFTVRATNSCSPVSQSTTSSQYTLKVNQPSPQCAPLAITTASLAGGVTGQSYSQQVQTSGGEGTVTLMIASGSLPPGLSLGSNRTITGTPTVAGTYNFTVQASDSCSAGVQRTQKPLSITVTAGANPVACPGGLSAPLITSNSQLPDGVTGQRYAQQQLQTSWGSSSATGVKWAVVQGTIPPGLGVENLTGLLFGTPTAAGTYTFTLEAAAASSGYSNCKSQKTFTLTIKQGGCKAVIDDVRATGDLRTGLNVTVSYHNERAGTCCAKVMTSLKGPLGDLVYLEQQAGSATPNRATFNFTYANWLKASNYRTAIEMYQTIDQNGNPSSTCNYDGGHWVRDGGTYRSVPVPVPPAQPVQQPGKVGPASQPQIRR